MKRLITYCFITALCFALDAAEDNRQAESFASIIEQGVHAYDVQITSIFALSKLPELITDKDMITRLNLDPHIEDTLVAQGIEPAIRIAIGKKSYIKTYSYMAIHSVDGAKKFLEETRKSPLGNLFANAVATKMRLEQLLEKIASLKDK